MNAESFLKDVTTHCAEVIREDGVYRHIRFSRPNTRCMWFDLITWPGHLCYTGDMGTYVFSRVNDMFEFFRKDTGSGIPISPGYWSEKCLAVDGGRQSGSVFEYDHDKFLAVINEYLPFWLEDLDEERHEEVREAFKDEVLDRLEDGDEHGNYRIANEFSMTVDGHDLEFTDLWERSFRRFTHHFLWCCYALVWGIDQYDKLNQKEDAA
ncbi:hypothetical protein ABZR11_28250 [Pseudomonas aeruginosa]